MFTVKKLTRDTGVIELAFADAVYIEAEEPEQVEPEAVPEEPKPVAKETPKTAAAPKKGGAKRKPLDMGKIKSLYDAKWSVPKIADEMGVSAPTIRKALEEIYK